MTALLVVDIQEEFVTSDILNNVVDYINNSQYDSLIFTVFENTKDSNFVKLLNYTDCMKTKPLIESDNLYKKSTYGISSSLIDKLKMYSQVDVIGTDIDACVMAICYQLFDAGINFRIITKYCYGILKDEAIKIMERNFGKAVVK